jgi:hypothetical protein
VRCGIVGGKGFSICLSSCDDGLGRSGFAVELLVAEESPEHVDASTREDRLVVPLALGPFAVAVGA